MKEIKGVLDKGSINDSVNDPLFLLGPTIVKNAPKNGDLELANLEGACLARAYMWGADLSGLT
ncbi:MAG: hypothetical protein LBU69_02515 [Deltaproteobacteria bacterium]|nr:hypothetical protein [Deltaproteobacteria bacterium]